MPEIIIGYGKNSKPSDDQVAWLGKLGIDPSTIMIKDTRWGVCCVMSLPDQGFITRRGYGAFNTPNKTVEYCGRNVLEILDLPTDQKILKVNKDAINSLNEQGKLPKKSAELENKVEAYKKTWQREQEYKSLQFEFNKFCSQYITKLEVDLKKYCTGEDSYRKPSAENPLDLLAYEKRQIIIEAQRRLNTGINTGVNTPSENIHACLDYLKQNENKDILKQSRDSSYMIGAKYFLTFGIGFMLWRAFWGDDLTEGMYKVSLFSKKYDVLQNSENEGLDVQKQRGNR